MDLSTLCWWQRAPPSAGGGRQPESWSQKTGVISSFRPTSQSTTQHRPVRKHEQMLRNVKQCEIILHFLKILEDLLLLLLTSSHLVSYRIFTLDHTFRPSEEVFEISVIVSRYIFIKNKENFELLNIIIRFMLLSFYDRMLLETG